MTKIKNFLRNMFDNIDKLTMIAFSIFVACYIIDSSVIAKDYDAVVIILKILRYACYAFFAVRVIWDVLKERKVPVAMLASFAVALGVVIFAKNITFAFAILILSAMRNFDIKRVAKWAFFVMGTIYFVIVILALVGVLPDWLFVRGTEWSRHAIGFTYPTDAIAVYLSIMILATVAFGTKIPYAALAIAEAVGFGLYWYTDGRLSFILVTVLVVALAAYKTVLVRAPKVNKAIEDFLSKKVVKWVLFSVPFIFCVIAIAIVLLYRANNGLAVMINGLLSDRLLHSSNALYSYPLLPFGTFVEWQGFGGVGYAEVAPENFVYNFVDISYIRGLFDYGIIAMIAIMLGYGFKVKKEAEKKNVVMVLALLVMLLWCFVEPFIFVIGKNVMVVCLAKYMGNFKISAKPINVIADKVDDFLK